MNFRYGLMNSPLKVDSIPSQLEYTWDREFRDPANPLIRHGVISCRELTEEEVYIFELVDLNPRARMLIPYRIELTDEGIDLILT